MWPASRLWYAGLAAMGTALSIEELARRTGEPVERLEDWRARGLVGTADGLASQDVERVRLVQLCLRRGIGLDTIADWARSGRMVHYLELLAPPVGEARISLVDAAAAVGLDPAVVERVTAGAAFSGTEDMDADDVEMLRALKTALDAGFTEDTLRQFVRVYTDALGRVAEAESRLFRLYVLDRIRAQGLAGLALVEAMNEAGRLTTPLSEPVLRFFHRRALDRAIREDAVLELAEEAGLLPHADTPGQLVAAIVFVDLSSFTPLAEAMGDARAAEVLERFSRLVRDAAAHADGRIVKQIGDAFMLAFNEARAAVGFALDVERRAAAEAQFPAVRSGIHWGPVLYREGDYVGGNVNLAARLATEAARHQVLVTAAVRQAAHGLGGVEFVGLGRRKLKGLSEVVDLWEVRAAEAAAPTRLVDPVCGMELAPAEVAARLALDGRERVFCSEDCLRRFVTAPERYSA